jgi:signal transduction histidine kinase
MIDRVPIPKLPSSIFSKLLAIMLGMAAVLLAVVAGFFVMAVFPGTVEDYTRVLTATSPSLGTAKSLRKQLDVEMRYEGPDGTWTTSEALPTVVQVRNGEAQSHFGRQYYLTATPNGGTYLVAWNFRSKMHATHVKLLWMVLGLIVVVVLAAFSFQNRLLRPVRALSDGVGRMSNGQLDIALPVVTHDELGTLTAGFNQMVGQVKRMLQARDQLLLDVSHELRSPLTRMKVALALLPEEVDRACIETDVNDMEIMISELIELERLRSPRGLQRQNQDLVPILHDVARMLGSKSPGIRVAADPKSILVEIDGDKIRTMLRNLLENAFKYSLPDSQPVVLSICKNHSSIVIRVQDDGQGIPEAHMTNIFEPFFRIDPSRSKTTGGYGLGLSLCKRIIEAHGGTIRGEKNPGRGASFVLTLPASA